MLEEAKVLDERAKLARGDADDRLLERLAREMIALGEAGSDRETIALGCYHLGVALNNTNRGEESERVGRRGLALFEELGDRYNASKVMMNLAALKIDYDLDTSAARAYFEAALPGIRDSGEVERLGIALGNLGEVVRLEGDYRGAIAKAREALECFLKVERFSSAGLQLSNIAL